MFQNRVLQKAKKTLIHVYRLFKRCSKSLSKDEQQAFRMQLSSLQAAIMASDPIKAESESVKVQNASKSLKKSFAYHIVELISALAFALIVAFAVRQMWFEFYEIPTGSMRPTLKEKDRLMVSKTSFGVNLPFTTDHILFEPELVQRSGIFIFTGENMDIRDVDTMYFYLFPGKKQYIKRLMGKPGDTLYFYGGKIYGIDAQGNDITEQLNLSQLNRIDHVPFIYFEGKTALPPYPEGGIYTSAVISQMNMPIARLNWNPYSGIRGTIISDSNVPALQTADYGDLWGINNFAMARLLTKDQVRSLTDTNPDALGNAALYLELRHHPSFHGAHLALDDRGRFRPVLGVSTSIVPLQLNQLQTLFANLYTARFYVKDGVAFRYGSHYKNPTASRSLPRLPGIPDGCYEFYYGKAYSVGWQGISSELQADHPLCQFDVSRLAQLFNLGIEFDTHFAPQTKNQPWYPSRFAYFLNGDLYVMGGPLLFKDDPTLQTFVESEKGKVGNKDFFPFVDKGPPLKNDGMIDQDFMNTYGIRIPEKSYLALGDNYAMSADSRDFGFVPQGNIRGAPEFIFWPPGSRFGDPEQPPYPVFNFPRTCIWMAVIVICIVGWTWHRRRTRLPLKDL